MLDHVSKVKHIFLKKQKLGNSLISIKLNGWLGSRTLTGCNQKI